MTSFIKILLLSFALLIILLLHHTNETCVELWFSAITRGTVAFNDTFCTMAPTKHNSNKKSAATKENDDDGKQSSDLPDHYNSIWDCEKLSKYTDKDGKKRWRCCWCGKSFGGWNATKAIAHVLRNTGQEISLCKARVSPEYRDLYVALSNRISKKRQSQLLFHNTIDMTIDHKNNETAAMLESKRRKPSPGLSTLDSSRPSAAGLLSAPASVSNVPQVPSILSFDINRSQEKTQVQLRLTDGPNPMADSKLTMAIADFIHSYGLNFSLAQKPKFRKILALARAVGSDYKPPSRNQVAGELLDLNYESYINSNISKLMKDADVYGVCLLGDGATVKRMPLINVLGSSPNNWATVLEIVDCSEHMRNGGIKDAIYIASLFRPYLDKFEQMSPGCCDLMLFDGAGNVQKSGEIQAGTYPRLYCVHGAEHVVSLFFGDVFRQPYMAGFFSIAKRAYNVFGSGARHGPYAIFQGFSKAHNKGRNIGLIRAAGTRMAGAVIVLLRLLRCKEPLLATISSIEFIQLKVS